MDNTMVDSVLVKLGCGMDSNCALPVTSVSKGFYPPRNVSVIVVSRAFGSLQLRLLLSQHQGRFNSETSWILASGSEATASTAPEQGAKAGVTKVLLRRKLSTKESPGNGDRLTSCWHVAGHLASSSIRNLANRGRPVKSLLFPASRACIA